MNFRRADRVGELIMAEMSDILLKVVKDPRLHSVTITGVKVTDDLRNARIYFVEMGKDELNEDVQTGLSKARGFVRRELGHRLQLRFVPEIIFVHDKSFGYGNHIEKLLAEIARQEENHD
ncbi:MAG TPA: 30S ribosome-binding factor RbfA [Smithellaceae bacterium]|jgi:ribosome-binding factor A|nr:30S ribosome-binding factor RbfA [Smithellaceae bacterium]HOG81439.1 30S ribosome-binding factor RbfA [Smithellaceae bacterium]HQP25172.1 30S ribosome-binding factor RbfA [Smithellaceae bacterium]